MSDLPHKIEALLFASGKGLSIEEIAEFCDSKPAYVKKAIEALEKEFSQRDGSLEITQHNGKWKMAVIGKYTEYVKKIVSETELPGPILKTLAVVAYKSPVLQADIIHMRGQGAYEHIKVLAKQKLITKDEEGRSFILRITDKFFNYFDVEGDQEIREVFAALKAKDEERRAEIQQEQVEKEKLKQQKLAGLEVVDSDGKDHAEIFEGDVIVPKTKQKSEEEIAEEKEFLSSMDSQIDEIASRLDKHKLPERNQETASEEEPLHDDQHPPQEHKKELEEDEQEEENYL